MYRMILKFIRKIRLCSAIWKICQSGKSGVFGAHKEHTNLFETWLILLCAATCFLGDNSFGLWRFVDDQFRGSFREKKSRKSPSPMNSILTPGGCCFIHKKIRRILHFAATLCICLQFLQCKEMQSMKDKKNSLWTQKSAKTRRRVKKRQGQNSRLFVCFNSKQLTAVFGTNQLRHYGLVECVLCHCIGVIMFACLTSWIHIFVWLHISCCTFSMIFHFSSCELDSTSSGWPFR